VEVLKLENEMFDKIFNFDNTERMPSEVKIKADVKVKEEKAPTDRSIELAIEHEKKARERIVESYAFRVNTIEGAIVVMSPCYYNFSYEVRVAFDLNGKKIQFVYEIPDTEFRRKKTIFEMAPLFKKRLADHLATSILTGMEIEDQDKLFQELGRGAH
jgi:hypothetical protein